MPIIELKHTSLGDIVNCGSSAYVRPNAIVAGKHNNIYCIAYIERGYGYRKLSTALGFSDSDYVENIKLYGSYEYYYGYKDVVFVESVIINKDNVCLSCKLPTPHARSNFICKSCEVEMTFA